jgi:malonyl-CoA O-methyltransferase
MRINKNQLVRQMNRATAYDEFGIVYHRMAYRLLLGLKEKVPHPVRILEMGCGTGYLTQLLLDFFPRAEITAVDLAEKRIDTAKERVEPAARVHFLAEDVERSELMELGPFDLVVSNFMIHWLEDPEVTLKKICGLLREGGWFSAATYGPDSLHELRVLFTQVEQEIGTGLEKHFLPLRGGEEWEGLLRQAGFWRVFTEEGWQRMEYEDCRSFLETIKAMGESYSATKQNLLVQRKVLTEVMQRYNLAYRSSGGVYATFHLLSLMGQKTRQWPASSCHR